MADTIFNASTTTPTTNAQTFNLSGLKDSTDWTVDPKTQTVSGQLESVLATDSPLIQRARAKATEAMNSRGLSNSSMAIGAADSAMYDAALPIAQGNAQTYADAAKTNVLDKNQFNLQSNGQAYDLQKGAVNQGYTQTNLATQQGYDLAKMDAQTANTLKTMSADQQNTLAKMAVSQGYDLSKMDAQTRNTLTTMGVEQQNALAKMAVSQGYDLSKMTAQQLNQLQLVQAQQQNNLQTLSTQYGFDLGKMDAQTRNTLTTMGVEQQNALAKLASQNGYTLGQMAAQSGYDISKLKVQAAAAMDVADIEAAYKNVTQGSAAATSILTKMQDSLNALNANTSITDAKVRESMAADIKTNTAEALNLVGSMASDADLSKYINAIGL